MDRLNFVFHPPPFPCAHSSSCTQRSFLFFFVPALHQFFPASSFHHPSMVISVDAFTVVALSLMSHRLLEERGMIDSNPVFVARADFDSTPFFPSSVENGERKRFFII
ncbi:hypothetical protein CEXT_709311 [Caerostris extrusa]|uniref:Uncharacterized protein n=1 Tax=Caerostris extrusa TaxID=172846 RepID=A0AAV4MP45_CAEEX|nr:hypothetical protein CEXT_709311 [Caerostris extrusa]